MSAAVQWSGLAELREGLRRLPAELADEGGAIVANAGEDAAAEIRAAYPRRARAALAESVKVEQRALNAFGSRAIVAARAKEAGWFEYGTQARHTNLGANRGSMPARPTFVPIMRRRRREMYEQLKALLVRAGLVVSGEAD